ncbi:unnamed protein product, partial [Effrenium voratum]
MLARPRIGLRGFSSAAPKPKRIFLRVATASAAAGSVGAGAFVAHHAFGALEDALGRPRSRWYEFYWNCCKDSGLYALATLQSQAAALYGQLLDAEAERPEPSREVLRERLKAHAQELLAGSAPEPRRAAPEAPEAPEELGMAQTQLLRTWQRWRKARA